MKRLSVLSIVLVIAASSSLAAPPPEGWTPPTSVDHINIQGSLIDPTTGDPYTDGYYRMEFDIYDDITSGTKVLDTPENSIYLKNGVFNHNLSLRISSISNDEIVFDPDREYYMQINVNGASLSPRQRLVSVPFARSLKGGEVDAVTLDGTAYAVRGLYYDGAVERTYGYLGSADFGAYGRYIGRIDTTPLEGPYGYLGSNNYGVYGRYKGFSYGYLGSSAYGACGRYVASDGTSGPYGYLGLAKGGILGKTADAPDIGAETDFGVAGLSNTGNGVYGLSNSTSDWKAGVYGANSAGKGVMGWSDTGIGVHGRSANGYGVYGIHTGDSVTKAGVYGECQKGYAVYGKATGTGYGVRASSVDGKGIITESVNGAGIFAYGNPAVEARSRGTGGTALKAYGASAQDKALEIGEGKIEIEGASRSFDMNASYAPTLSINGKAGLLKFTNITNGEWFRLSSSYINANSIVILTVENTSNDFSDAEYVVTPIIANKATGYCDVRLMLLKLPRNIVDREETVVVSETDRSYGDIIDANIAVLIINPSTIY